MLNTALSNYSEDAVINVKQQMESNTLLSAEVKQVMMEQVGLIMEKKSTIDTINAKKEIFLQMEEMEKSQLSTAEEDAKPEIQVAFALQRQELEHQLSWISKEMQDMSVSSFQRTFHAGGYLLSARYLFCAVL